MKKKFNILKFLLFLFVLLIIIVASLVGLYFYMISPISKKSEKVEFYVNEGDNYSNLSTKLKESGLIRNELAYKIYIKLNTPDSLEYGLYYLDKSDNIEGLINTFERGSMSQAETKTVTFVEGKNMRYIISTITSNFNITEKEILNLLKNEDYLDSLIDEYWFLTDDIKNKEIYYSLEGYLYPDTYEFYTNASVKDIFNSMLNNMNTKLTPYKESIEKSKYSIHEILTLASIVELEAGSASDRKGVAGVFYNRLEDGWSLGSDVTTYYAEKIDNYSRDLKQSELDKCNAYNTRNTSCMAGKLPVSPICNAGLESIIAAIEPTSHDYYYFVADKNGKTYFTKTDAEHTQKCNELKRKGLWIEYTD